MLRCALRAADTYCETYGKMVVSIHAWSESEIQNSGYERAGCGGWQFFRNTR